MKKAVKGKLAKLRKLGDSLSLKHRKSLGGAVLSVLLYGIEVAVQSTKSDYEKLEALYYSIMKWIHRREKSDSLTKMMEETKCRTFDEVVAEKIWEWGNKIRTNGGNSYMKHWLQDEEGNVRNPATMELGTI